MGVSSPGKGPSGETCSIPLISVALVLVVTLFVWCLRFVSGLPFLPCYAWLWREALTARAQVEGSKVEPLVLYTDRSPRAWATHERNALLG